MIIEKTRTIYQVISDMESGELRNHVKIVKGSMLPTVFLCKKTMSKDSDEVYEIGFIRVHIDHPDKFEHEIISITWGFQYAKTVLEALASKYTKRGTGLGLMSLFSPKEKKEEDKSSDSEVFLASRRIKYKNRTFIAMISNAGASLQHPREGRIFLKPNQYEYV